MQFQSSLYNILFFDPAKNTVSDFDHVFSGGIGRSLIKLLYFWIQVMYPLLLLFPACENLLLCKRYSKTQQAKKMVDTIDLRAKALAIVTTCPGISHTAPFKVVISTSCHFLIIAYIAAYLLTFLLICYIL